MGNVVDEEVSAAFCNSAVCKRYIVATYNIQAVNVGVNAVNLVLHTNNNIIVLGHSSFHCTGIQ